MNRASRWLSVLFAAAALAASAFAGDVPADYQKRYSNIEYRTVREEVLKELVAAGKPEAMKALEWCVSFSKTTLDDKAKQSEKLRTRLVAAQQKFDVKMHDYIEQLKKAGDPDPDVKRHPAWPESEDLLKAQAEVEQFEKFVIIEQELVVQALDAHGTLVAKFTPDQQKAVRDDWTKTRLSQKDWGLRSEGYEMLGHTPTDWALDMLAAAVLKDGPQPEPDSRALVVAIDGLSGRAAAKASPALVSRIDDARWVVRVAVVRALEMTPSKEGIDAVVKRMAKEDGRLKEDCARALVALTGKTDIPANPEMWRIWWESNREKWTGKPDVPKEAAQPNPMDGGGPVATAEDKKKTGFFGIQIESRRLVFVIDISGSMVDPMGGNGPDAKASKASLAKAELKRVLGAMEDGALFDIVFFATVVRVWKPEMQKADAKTRKEAQDFVDAAEVVGATNSYDALEAAFGLGDVGKGKKREADPTGDARVDTIMFLSDGVPTAGRSTDPDQIRAAVKTWNRARRIMIHAVAFGTAAKGGADPKFMKGLADDTGGKYVEK